MRKPIAILFFIAFTISTTHVHELLKMNEFIKHYTEHKNADSKMSFWKFVSLHYMSGDIKDADYAKDMKLPFKTITPSCLYNILITLPSSFTIKPAVIFSGKNYALSHLSFHQTVFIANIWQPPKIC